MATEESKVEVPASKIVVSEEALHTAPLEDVAAALTVALKANFRSVEVEIVACPDLSAGESGDGEWGLAYPGLGSDDSRAVMLDLGHVDDLCIPSNQWKTYELGKLFGELKLEAPHVLGAGAGIPAVTGRASEAMPNMKVGGKNLSTYSTVLDDGTAKQGAYESETLGLFQNLFVTDGQAGKVLRVHAEGKTGEANFTDCLKAGLDTGFEGKDMALGGVFKLTGSKMHIHIMDSFPNGSTTVNEFIKTIPRFNVAADDLVALTTVVSGSRLRPLNNPHTHCFAKTEGEVGGHYHHATEPEGAVYDGYFKLASQFIAARRVTEDDA